MNVLDLFSGIGGFSLGLERAGMTTVGFCEIDPYARRVLAKHWPDVPIHDDVRTLEHDGPVDLICGGYPCQPFSLAGKRVGTGDDRHLWPEMLRIVDKHRPAWVIGENVAGHISMGLDQVLSDLEGIGYTVRPFVLPAVAVDAPHRRDRVWIIANSESVGRGQGVANHRGRAEGNGPWKEQRPGHGRETLAHSLDARVLQRGRPDRAGEESGEFRRIFRDGVSSVSEEEKGSVADAPGEGFKNSRGCKTSAELNRQRTTRNPSRGSGESQFWRVKPELGGAIDGLPPELDGGLSYWADGSWDTVPRIASGIANRVDRLKCLGNAVVPQVVERIGRAIMEIEYDPN
jgi:DNA (cytosine-5)-methyltransferase 1